MRRSSVPVQCDLFASVPTALALGVVQRHHDELVELLSQLLWEAAQGLKDTTNRESPHEQDQR